MKEHPEFLTKIDWKLLREQKRELSIFIQDIDWERGIQNVPQLSFLEGIIYLIDAIQDYGVDEMGISEEEVFNLNPEEE